jgi:hypothetical protein
MGADPIQSSSLYVLPDPTGDDDAARDSADLSAETFRRCWLAAAFKTDSPPERSPRTKRANATANNEALVTIRNRFVSP